MTQAHADRDSDVATGEPALKDSSQIRQKEMIGRHFDRLAQAPQSGEKCVSTFVPGNLTELLHCFDLVPILPEINALQSGMRGKSREYISTAEKLGHSEDVCTYVKCDVGMMKSGNVGPTGARLPDPDLLLLSYTGCFTFLKWFEILREEYECPVTMLHVPYQGDGVITDSMRAYVVKQLETEVIPALDYYTTLRGEIEQRLAAGLGPVTPDGQMDEERFRLVVEGPPNWTSFRQFWKMFAEEGAVVVASSYTKVGGVYDNGFRHDPDRPLESLAEYCMGCYTNLNLPSRVDMLCRYVEEYDADGLFINSIKSCNSFSAGQLMILREVENRTGRPGGFIESDLVDPRYFSASNIKNRMESYFQMIEQKRQGAIA
jgi:benzoyl-CoA reductase/2-hydroxyglutaryl-CoA dehydratase subunit BcrC/BadD/HgdB